MASRVNRPTRVTLRHVAENAGVSVGTVSDIANRGMSQLYATATQKKVREAMRRLGYRPARAAQDLRRGRSNTVGVILTRGFDNPYYARLFNELKLALQRHGLSAELMILNTQQQGAVRTGSDWMISQGVDGVIVGPLYYWDEPILHELRDLKRRGMPIVTFGSVDDEAGIRNVVLHDEQGGQVAAEFLLKLGHRRVGFLGAYQPADAPRGRGTAQEGVEKVLTAEGVLDPGWFIESPDSGRYEPSFESAGKLAQRWLAAAPAERPTALICKTDQIAITALAAFHEHGIDVPRDLSVMGYDNVPESAYTIPALTTVDNAMSERIAAVVDDIAGTLKVTARRPATPPPVTLRVVERASVRLVQP